jgi:membrane associated rhomboid family serine protease
MIPLRDNIPSRTFPFINYTIIALNTLVFLFELKLAGMPLEGGGRLLEGFIYKFGVVPERFFADVFAQIPTVFSSMFIHGGWTHFIGNMLYLYIFGDNVEDNFGHMRYAVIYLLCGAVAALLQSALSAGSSMPMIGASGAIAGVLGSYIFLYPRARIETLVFFGFFIRVIEIPALIYLGFWFVMQAMSGTLTLASASASGHEIGGVAFWAHVGGFAAGAALVNVLIKHHRARRFW